MKYLYLSIAILLLASCGEDAEGPERGGRFVPPSLANEFLTFVNTQASLAAGDYQLKVLADSATTSFGYRISLGINDQPPLDIAGDFVVGQDNTIDFTLHSAGGIRTHIHSDTDQEIELVLMKDGYEIAKSSVDEHGQPIINLTPSKISSEQYSKAYYRAVDPNQARTTLEDWKQVNGFDQDDELYVVFRDTKDLGYGRSMFARQREDGGMAVFVDNYVVQLGNRPSPTNYSSLNVEAAVDQNREYHVGTNAIEFSRADENDPDSPFILKFFTFNPEDENGVQTQRLVADLDGRGPKPVPTNCISCHGGALLPLDNDGNFQLQALQTAKYNQLEINTFEYSELNGFTLADQEANLKQLNQYIYQTFVAQNERARDKGHWSAGFAMELASGRYGGEFNENTFQADFIPEGWRQNGNRPDGVETLFKSVIEPHCVSCHSLRGTSIGEETLAVQNGEEISLSNAVNFSSYEKFISFSDRIIDYVYKRGQMPLSARNFELFWQNPDGKPSFLASFLPGFDVVDENNKVQPPGKPFAKIVAASSIQPPTFVMGQQSYFASEYQWRVSQQPVGAEISLAATNGPNLLIESASDGEYEIELIVRNQRGEQSQPETLNIVVDNNDTDTLNFVEDIRPIMGTSDNTSCSECHRVDSEYPGIPAYYADSNPDQYLDIIARVDFSDPANSPILIKPTSLQHGGAIRLNRNTDQGEQDYQTILKWILAGAPCGNDEDICGD